MRIRTLIAISALLFSAAACGDDDGGDGNTPRPDSGIVLPPDANMTTADAGMPPQTSCDTVVQDCMDPAMPKCTIIYVGMTLTVSCVAQTGTVGRDMTCTRAAQGNSGVGRDDCDKGLFCSGLTFPLDAMGNATMRACREFCRNDTTCEAGERCYALGGNLMPPNGLCLKSCALFGADCMSGTTCSISSLNATQNEFAGLCRPIGTEPAGAACESSNDCQANMQCLFDMMGNGTCGRLCDNNNPCAMGTCNPVPGLPNGGGFCASM